MPRRRGRRPDRRARRGRRGLAGRRPRAAVPDRDVRRAAATAAPAASRSAPRRLVHQLLDLRRLRRAARLQADAARSASRTASPTSRRPRRRRSPSARPGTCSFTRGGLRPGETVLINSVGSGIGSAAVQLAKLAGAFVIGNVEPRRQARAGERARPGRRDQPHDAGRRRRGDADHRTSRGVDLVFEHVGGELFQKGLDSLAKDGRLVICGAHAGEVVPFDIIPFFRRQLLGDRLVRLHPRRGRARASSSSRSGKLQPHVAATFPLDAGEARRWT